MKNQKGVTMVETVLLAALVSIAAMVSVTTVGKRIAGESGPFGQAGGTIEEVLESGTTGGGTDCPHC